MMQRKNLVMHLPDDSLIRGKRVGARYVCSSQKQQSVAR